MSKCRTTIRTFFAGLPIVFFTFCCLVPASKAEVSETCPEGYSQRVILANNCADAAYAIITPPSDKTMKELWGTVGTKENKVIHFTEGGTDHYKIKIASEKSQPLCIPEGGIASGNFKFYLGCDEDKSDDSKGYPIDCAIGSQPGHVDFPVSSKFELTTGCIPNSTCNKNPSDPTENLISTDFYDISNVDGYNMPMRIDETISKICNFQSMESLVDLWSCPQEDRSTISRKYANPQIDHGINLYLTQMTQNGSTQRTACASFDKWLEVSGPGQHPENNLTVQASDAVSYNDPNIMDWYACNVMPEAGADKHPATCITPGCGGPQCAVGPDGTLKDYNPKNLAQGKGKPYTNYVKRLKATGNHGYAWQFNDDASTVKCELTKDQQPVITLTLCPGHKGQKPYKPQNWAYINNKCVVDNTKDSKIAHYASLWDCQVKNVKFTCQSEFVQKLDNKDSNKNIKAQLNYCMPVDMNDSDAVRKGLSWDECNRSFCQERGNTIDVCILNKLEEQYPEYLKPAKTPSIKMGDLLFREYVKTQTIVGLFIGDDPKYSNTVLYVGRDDDEVHVIGNIESVAEELKCQ